MTLAQPLPQPPTLPPTMPAIQIAPGGGPPDVLQPVDLPVPQPGPGQVLIAVEAAGVNRPDVLQRSGLYPPPADASPLPGLEVAGAVVALGVGVTEPALGARVTALVHGGGYAAFCVAEAPLCLPWPAGYDALKAAALPETVFTVWGNLFTRGRLAAGESVLIHGGSSGIGTIAIQLAVARGASVLTTVGSAEKAAAVAALGAQCAINYRTQSFAQAVRDATAGAGVDVILDMVGAPYFADNIALLKPDGRLVQIAFLDGAKVASFDLRPIMMKRLTVTGSTLRPQSLSAKAAIAADLRTHVWPLLEAGRVAPIIHQVFPLQAAADAHRLMETSSHIGKIMLRVAP